MAENVIQDAPQTAEPTFKPPADAVPKLAQSNVRFWAVIITMVVAVVGGLYVQASKLREQNAELVVVLRNAQREAEEGRAKLNELRSALGLSAPRAAEPVSPPTPVPELKVKPKVKAPPTPVPEPKAKSQPSPTPSSESACEDGDCEE